MVIFSSKVTEKLHWWICRLMVHLWNNMDIWCGKILEDIEMQRSPEASLHDGDYSHPYSSNSIYCHMGSCNSCPLQSESCFKLSPYSCVQWCNCISSRTYKKTEDVNKHLPCLEAPGLPGDRCIFFLSSMFSVNRSLDKKSLERLSPWLACHYH